MRDEECCCREDFLEEREIRGVNGMIEIRGDRGRGKGARQEELYVHFFFTFLFNFLFFFSFHCFSLIFSVI